MTYIPPIGYEGAVSFNWEVINKCGFTGSATATINVACPTCDDEENRYVICDATIDQLSAEHDKADGVDQVPFSLYRKGPASLRSGASAGSASLTVTFTDAGGIGWGPASTVGDNSTIALTSVDGTSVTYIFASGSTGGNNPEFNGGATTAAAAENFAQAVENPTFSSHLDKIYATDSSGVRFTSGGYDFSDGIVVLTQVTCGLAGNGNVVSAALFSSIAGVGASGFTGGTDGGGTAYTITKGYDGLTVTGSDCS